MIINIKEVRTPTYERTEDGDFRCNHANVEVTAPCCSGRDSENNISCGCYGSYSVYCPDCRNDDLNESDVERILDTEYSEPDYE